MTEYQEVKASKELGTESWFFVGYAGKEEREDGWKVYQTNSGVLFAACPDGTKMSFEVYSEDNVFLVY